MQHHIKFLSLIKNILRMNLNELGTRIPKFQKLIIKLYHNVKPNGKEYYILFRPFQSINLEKLEINLRF